MADLAANVCLVVMVVIGAALGLAWALRPDGKPRIASYGGGSGERASQASAESAAGSRAEDGAGRYMAPEVPGWAVKLLDAEAEQAQKEWEYFEQNGAWPERARDAANRYIEGIGKR